MKKKLLIIGYGNSLRGDDGLGPALANAILEMRLPGVQIHIAHQLTPELAEKVSHFQSAVFIDASVELPRRLRVRRIDLAKSSLRTFTHSCAPEDLLQLAQSLFFHAPKAWWITLPAYRLGFGAALSPLAHKQLAKGVRAFERLWATLLPRQMPGSPSRIRTYARTPTFRRKERTAKAIAIKTRKALK